MPRRKRGSRGTSQSAMKARKRRQVGEPAGSLEVGGSSMQRSRVVLITTTFHGQNVAHGRLQQTPPLRWAQILEDAGFAVEFLRASDCTHVDKARRERFRQHLIRADWVVDTALIDDHLDCSALTLDRLVYRHTQVSPERRVPGFQIMLPHVSKRCLLDPRVQRVGLKTIEVSLLQGDAIVTAQERLGVPCAFKLGFSSTSCMRRYGPAKQRRGIRRGLPAVAPKSRPWP